MVKSGDLDAHRNAVISSTIQLPDSEPLTAAAADGNAEALELHKEGQVQELNCSGCPYDADVDNRTLHLNCQKKIDELMSSTHDLTSKLDDAQSKVELYGKRQQLFSDFLDKLKNTILLFELSRAAE